LDIRQEIFKKEIAMKKIVFLSVLLLSACFIYAQAYPEPEFSNEVYYLKKENPYSLVRLEKNSAKQETKMSMIKGSEYGYEIEGKSSPIRFSNGNNISFIFSNGNSSANSKSDSVMRANGVDPNALAGMSGDPSSTITLYKLDVEKDSRKIYMQKTGGYFGNHKNQASAKFTFSLKKIRDGYWELVIDKPLPKGEYAFSMMGMGMQAMDGSQTVFAFGID
jgi:hypothetical protein